MKFPEKHGAKATGAQTTDLNGRLPLRVLSNGPFLSDLEQESIALFHAVKAEAIPGAWEPSPVEEKYQQLRELLLTTPGVLRGFRHSFLAAGRLSFPDMPRPKEYYLQWDDSLAGQKRLGALQLLKLAIRLYRRRRFELADLDDNLVGQPTTYGVPKSVGDGLRAIGRRFLKFRSLEKPECYHITEAQIRYLYYRTQISSLVGTSLGSVLEVGGGYGGLAAQLLQHLTVGRYVFIELPDAMPLAYYYLRASFDCQIQAVYLPEHGIDPQARIVILAPWKLPDLDGEIDLLINTMSFQHMLAESVEFYLSYADRLKAKYLYLVNRDTKRDPTDLIISQYPIPACYNILYRKPWLFGPHLEMVYQRGQEEKR